MIKFIPKIIWLSSRSVFTICLTFIASLIFILFTSCESFIEVELPNSQLTAEAVFTEEATAEAALLDLYAQMRDRGIVRDLYYEIGLYTDELEFYGSSTSSKEAFHKNNLIPSHPTVSNWWNAAYTQIYGANALIQGLETSELDEAFKKQLRGEALFIRGFSHFYLSCLYGDVPYITDTDYQQNTRISKSPVTEVLNQVVVDLKEAITLLDWEYPVADRTRVNKGVALAALSRVSMYQGAWQQAAEAATVVINRSDLYVWEVDLHNVFLKESNTILWQFSPRGAGVNTAEATSFIFSTAPPPSVALTNNLVSSFEDADQRLAQWIQEVSDGSQTYYHAFKYKTRGNTSSSVEYSILFRLSELYLTRSEAYAQLDQLELAAQDLNTVRSRAALADVAYTGKEDLLDQILNERRHELFTEAGHRFFDLKRTNQLDAVLEPLKSGWEPTDQLLPLPENELLINPNLAPQNPGYQSEN